MRVRWRWVGLVLVLCAPAQAQTPRIDAIDPGEGPIAGGTVVTVKGANLAGVSLVVDKVAVAAQAISTSELRFTTPAHDNGFAVIKLTGSGGAAFGEFLYVPPKLKDLPAGYITTVAGMGLYTAFYHPATEAEIQPQGKPAFDRQGNLYFPEPGNDRIIRVRADGIMEPFAGNGIAGFRSTTGNGDGGPAVDAVLWFCRGITLDDDGDAYITAYDKRIRKVDGRTGIITTYAGNGTAGFSGDGGPAINALLHGTTHICGDGQGTIWFIDYDDATYVARIRRITPDGIITTVAGVGPPGFAGDGGPAAQAQFDLGMADNGALAVDPDGNLFMVDHGNRRIRRIDARTGIITTVHGPADVRSVACDTGGNLYFADRFMIQKMNPAGRIVATYGSGLFPGLSPDGTPFAEAYLNPWDISVDPQGNIVFTEMEPRWVRRINVATGRLETVAGMLSPCVGETGPAVATTLAVSNGDLAILPTGELLIADDRHGLARKIDAGGAISTVYESSTAARLAGRAWAPVTAGCGIETTMGDDIYAVDTRGIYRIDANRTAHTIVQGGERYGYAGDGGPALTALLCQPWDVALDAAGNLFIADTNNNRIRRIDAQTGIITTVAGTGPVNGFERYGPDGQGGYAGDGGPATEARLNTPYGIAIDAAGNLFVADGDGGYLRQIDPAGTITTVIRGVGSKLVFDRFGQLYSATNQVIRYDLDGIRRNATGSVTVLGSPEKGFSGDGGPVSQARTRAGGQACGVAVDAEGNVFFVDNGNLRIRAIRSGALVEMPRLTFQPRDTRVTAGQPATFAVTETGFPSATYQWQRNRVDLAGATGPSYTLAAAQTADHGARYTVAVTNAVGSVTSTDAVLTVTSDPTRPTVAGLTAVQAVRVGEPVTLEVLANGSVPLTYSWQFKGRDCVNGTGPALALATVQPGETGLYAATVSNAVGMLVTDPVIVGVTAVSKVVGDGRELLPADIRHPNGNTFDQVLVTGAAEAITADYALNQITRTSFIDLDNDIVQVEFSGPGTLSLVLDSPTGPATPVNYNQTTAYMKGHAGIVITEATEKTNVSVFCVGRVTAVNQALFKDSVTYDGIADLAFIAIASANGKFGGVRTANANYFAERGYTGIYAPGVEFAGPVFVGDVSAFDSAESVILLGAASDVRITGGSLRQDNAKPVRISGLTQLKFVAGGDSHGNPLPAQRNRAILMQNGEDVTSQVVVNPTP